MLQVTVGGVQPDEATEHFIAMEKLAPSLPTEMPDPKTTAAM
jgi:hypothetical protein